jgi:predicted alpha/beta hydrolase family esterase
MKVLFLHGWSSDGSMKTIFMRSHGYDVLTPRLSDWRFSKAVAQAQAAYQQFLPDVIVGSSRGGAVAMNMESGETPLVLLAPAWKRWGTATTVRKPNHSIIVHSSNDMVVPFKDSVDLCLNNPGLAIIPGGEDHRLNDPQAMKALKRALWLVTNRLQAGLVHGEGPVDSWREPR